MGVMRVDAKSPHEVQGKLFPLDFSNDSRLPVVICQKFRDVLWTFSKSQTFETWGENP